MPTPPTPAALEPITQERVDLDVAPPGFAEPETPQQREDRIFRETEAKFAEEAADTESISEREARRTAERLEEQRREAEIRREEEEDRREAIRQEGIRLEERRAEELAAAIESIPDEEPAATPEIQAARDELDRERIEENVTDRARELLRRRVIHRLPGTTTPGVPRLPIR